MYNIKNVDDFGNVHFFSEGDVWEDGQTAGCKWLAEDDESPRLVIEDVAIANRVATRYGGIAVEV